MSRRSLLAAPLLLLAAAGLRGQEPLLPPADPEPMMRLEAGGPTTVVNSLAFSPDGKALYAAGFDKVVRVWVRDEKGQFTLDRTSYRIPIGAGIDGVINSMALSADGTWLAVGGSGVVRGGPGGRGPGIVVDRVSAMTPAMWRDQGLIYVFNTRNPNDVRVLRGHTGPVLSLAFAPPREGKPPLLVSSAREWDGRAEKYVGALCVWDPDRKWDETGRRQQYLASRWDLPDPLRGKVLFGLGAVAFPAGDGPTRLRVGVAAADGRLRVWDVEADRVHEAADGAVNDCLTLLPGSARVASASMDAEGGQVRTWDVGGAGAPEPLRRVGLAADENKGFFPRALVPFAARPGGRVDHLAVASRGVRRDGGRAGECWLELIEWGSREGPSRRRLLLWQDTDLPALAAAGGYLAVAGNPDHGILVYAVKDLLEGRAEPEPLQRLRSAGEAWGAVAFAAGAKGPGLWLGKKPAEEPGARRKPAAGDLVFDFAAEALTDDLTGWKVTAPDLAGWALEHTPAETDEGGKVTRGPVLTVRQGDRVVRRITLRADEQVDDCALRPGRPPLLAVALRESGEPRLVLYNVATGDLLRHCVWHTGRIRSVAFSADAPLLASAAEDQMVCVWSLAHLDKILGRHGALRGVGVKAGDGGRGVVVSAVDEAGPAKGKLARGDVIEGLLRDKRLTPLATPLAFLEAVANLEPGAEVTLQVRAPGGEPRPVTLPVAQGTDERKPLLSLFITAGQKAADRDWVGWNPYGPYEASGRKAERLIGWHFNTGKPGAPARFALADEYRKGRYREGILKHLIAQGSVSPAVEAWEKEHKAAPAPRPNLGVEFGGPEDAVQEDPRGRLVLRRPPPSLWLHVEGGFPEDRVGPVRWQLVPAGAGGKPVGGAMTAVADHWEADLSALTWERRDYTLEVVMRTLEAEPREYARKLALSYRPAAPRLDFDPAWQKKHFGDTPPQRLPVRARTMDLAAEVRPGVPGVGVKVLLRQGDGPPRELEVRDGKVKADVELADGENRVELTAVNKDAPGEDEEAETARKVLVLTYVAPKVMAPAPSIILAEVEEVGEAKKLPVEAGRALTVAAPTVRVRGRVVAEEELTEAARDGKELAGFRPGAAREFPIDETVTLTPGKAEVRFVARTRNSAAAAVALKLDYRPQLPQVVWVTPVPDQVFAGESARKTTLTARLIEPPGGRNACKAVFLHNGKELPAAPAAAGRTLSAGVTLDNGENTFRVKLSNDWGREGLSEPLTVRFARPPHDIKFARPALNPAKPLADLSATVQTPLDLLPETVEAAINGRALRPTEVVAVAREQGEQTWRVAFKEVPLADDANKVELAVSNAEGRSRERGILEFAYKRAAAPPPPEVSILNPTGEGRNVTSPDVPLRFRVRSAAPLKRLELVRDGLVPFRQPFDVAGVKAGQDLVVSASLVPRAGAPGGPAAVDLGKAPTDPAGALQVTLPFPLEARDNRLRVEAMSAGGEGRAEVLINYVPAPVRVVFEAMEDRSRDPAVRKATPLPGGQVAFPEMGSARVELRGRVEWDDAADERLRRPGQQVRVYVNGFQQPPATLLEAEPGGRERRFAAPLVLSRKAGNVVEVEVPAEDGQEVNSRPQFLVDCADPATRQRLYLLLVSPAKGDPKALEERALRAFKTPAFVETITYALIEKDVTDDAVISRLMAVGKQIRRRAREGATNDVVLVYYAGAESVDRQGHYLQGGRDDPDRRLSGISCDGLAKFFPRLLGAQLLLLDVTRLPGDGAARDDRVLAWPPEVRTAVFRSAWLKDRDPEKVPADALVLTAWRQTMPRSSRLKDVDTSVAALFGQAFGQGSSPALRYDDHLPRCMEDMQVGGKR